MKTFETRFVCLVFCCPSIILTWHKNSWPRPWHYRSLYFTVNFFMVFYAIENPNYVIILFIHQDLMHQDFFSVFLISFLHYILKPFWIHDNIHEVSHNDYWYQIRMHDEYFFGAAAGGISNFVFTFMMEFFGVHEIPCKKEEKMIAWYRCTHIRMT